MKKSKKIFLLVIILLLICVTNIFQAKPKECLINFVISGTSEDCSLLTIFYDNGKTDYPFDETHMVNTATKITDIPQTVSISIPVESINKIRIDFGDYPGIFTISDLQVTIGLHEYTPTIKECTNKIAEQNDVREIQISETLSSLKILVSGNDGYIYFRNLLSDIKPKLSLNIIHMIIAILTIYIIYLCTLLLVQKLHPEQGKIISLPLSIIAFFAFIIITPYNEIFKKYFLSNTAKRLSILAFILLLLYLTLIITTEEKESKR